MSEDEKVDDEEEEGEESEGQGSAEENPASRSFCDSDSASDWDSEYDDQDFDRYYDYGDLGETGGSYVVQLEDDREISLEEHARTCACGL